jgi:hypothetical protein
MDERRQGRVGSGGGSAEGSPRGGAAVRCRTEDQARGEGAAARCGSGGSPRERGRNGSEGGAHHLFATIC